MALVKVVLLLFLCGHCSSLMKVERSAFKIWRQDQQTSQKNHIKLRFKTIHATGLIFFAQGANKKDFLSLELYRGKIRIAGNQGKGPENSLRPIAGLYELFLGKDLADNEWHTVEFIRNIRENIIFIDRGKEGKEKERFLKSPPTYTELSISIVAFGGFYSFDPSEIALQKSLSRKGFQGCFSEATFSQVWPEVASQQLDFMTSGHNGHNGHGEYMVMGDVLNHCPPISPPYAPMFFPSGAVHISLGQTYKMDNIKISIMFRTVISDQTLANYTHKVTGERIQFRLDRKGRISLNLDNDDNMQIIETARGNYHDGEWHTASFEIDNVLSAENSYVAKFTADGKTRLSTMSTRYDFNGRVHIGFGYTGCMREIAINDQPIDRVLISESEPGKFFTIHDVGVVHNACSLKDYCNPNPCYNGGKCNQTEDNVVCDCRDTLYEGSTCHRARFNYTCAGVRKSGERRSDVYYIDFDGMGPMEPVRALCDLGRTVEVTTTQINNTKYEDLDVSTTSGKSTVVVNYAANIIQMRELIMNSVYCEQEIKFTCQGAPLFRSPEGPPAASWMGGDDIMHYYWGGAQNNRGYCACGVTQTCRNNKKYCNCDDLEAFSNVWDEGNFTIKEHLPVREVKFDQVLKAGSLQAILRVGHLRCTGFGSRLNAATFRMPWSFLSVDHADQPFDNIYAGGISFEFKTSQAFNYMVMLHAHGPFSGDHLKIVIRSTTLIRVYFNTGFGNLKQDVDISATGRTINDNQWHDFNLMFNLKELNVTLDGVEMIQGLPLQDDPFQFNVDGQPVFVGGSYYDRHGFVGCIRSLHINGRIHDIFGIARGMEDFGVYSGCGSACMLLPKACNYGYCIDNYDSFKCNCSVSPNDGKYCGNETYPKQFSAGQFVQYDLPSANVTEPIAEAIIVLGFKTDKRDVALAQVTGEHNRHFSVALVGGYLTLMYSTKERLGTAAGAIIERDTEVLQITKRKLNNDKHNIMRLRFSTEEIYLNAVNYGLEIGANFTERAIDRNNLNRGTRLDVFGKIIKFTVGTIVNENGMIYTGGSELPTTFTGCMSGAKLVITPHATADKKVRTAIEIDIFKSINEAEGESRATTPNPSGNFPTSGERCGPWYPEPGVLPSVGPAVQFYTKSPGLDVSVDVTAIDTANQAILMVVILVVAVALLAFLYIIYKRVSVNNKTYNKTKSEKGKMPEDDKEKLYAKVVKPTTDDVQSGSGWKSPEQGYDDYL